MRKEVLVDDLDKVTEDAVKEHTFALDDVVYDIDLADPHWVKLNEAVKVFLDAARPRRVAPVVSMSKGRKKAARLDPAQLKQIRQWVWDHQDGLLKEQMKGRTLSGHGRIPQDLMDAYQRLAGHPARDEGGAGLFREAVAAR